MKCIEHVLWLQSDWGVSYLVKCVFPEMLDRGQLGDIIELETVP